MAGNVEPPTPHSHGETQWQIAYRQFRKRGSAVWGLLGVRILFYLAVFAPVLCCGLPLAWREPGGSLTFPWLAKVFDRLYWANGVDRFFNLLMFVVVVWWIVQLVLHLTLPDPAARARARGKAMRWAMGAVVVLGLLQGFKVPPLWSSEPYTDYQELSVRYSAQQELAEQRLLAIAVEQETATPDESATLDEERKTVAARLADLEGRTELFTFVPFGHREQSALGSVDRFRGPMERSTHGFHVLGTALEGQDVLAQLLYGTRISLTVGLLAVAIYVTIGLILGGIAGFVGGTTDLLIMRLVEIVMSVPGLFLILTIIALFNNRSIFMIMIAIGIVGWTGIARLVRGEFIRERGKDYVAAARSLGFSGPRILFRHIMPNAVAPVIVAASFGVASAIIVESTLSFLGLGDTNVPSWGQMLNVGRENGEWHLIIVPGLAIFVTVTMLNLVGDGLRDALDPKMRK